MALLRRRQAIPPASADPIGDFWTWWAEIRPQVSAALAGSGLGDQLVNAFTNWVGAIDGHLDWELAPGHSAQHALVLSAAGDRTLRAVTERWFRTAPSADSEWEYHPARQPDGNLHEAVLELGGHQIRTGEFVFGLDETQRAAVNLSVWHPSFSGVDEESRGRAVFLVLDWLFGEDMVETWIGGIGVEPPKDPLSPQEAYRFVAERRDRWDPDSWLLLQSADGSVLVRLRDPLPWESGMLCDIHLSVQVDRSVAGSDQVEDSLLAAVGADGLLLAVVTDGPTQRLHLQVLDLAMVRKRVEYWAEHCPGSPRCTWQPDPAWAAVRALT